MSKSNLALAPRVVGNMALVGQTRGQILAYGHADPMRTATDKQRAVAAARLDVAQAIMALERAGRTTRKAIAAFQDMARLGELTPLLQSALALCGKNGRTCPAKNTLREWRDVVAAGGGRVELLEKHKGRTTNVVQAWYGPALERFNCPGKNDIAEVWRYLTEVEGFAISYDQVLHYLNGVPAQVGRYSPARIGRNLYRLSQKAFVRRSTRYALPGDVYVADGYRADVYLAHPVTGGIWRPELTVIMDLRSRVIVGWRADEHEGTYAVQNAFAEAFARHNNVPAMLYVDNGSGYKNKFMSDPMTGFYERAGVADVIHAIPGNPHGKGWVERFFRTMHRDFLKGWMPQFYCGDDMAPEVLNHTVREVKAGRLQLPSLAQFSDAVNAWLDRYVRRPHPEDTNRSKLDVWRELVQYPPGKDVTELKRRVQVLVVRRGTLRQGKRWYRHPDLLAFNGQKVQLGYDLMDDRVAVVSSMEGRWICDAVLDAAIDVIDANRLEEMRRKREEGQIKRKERAIAEDKARARQVIDVDAIAQAVIDVTATPVLPGPGADDDITLDLTDLSHPDHPDLEDL